MALLFGVREGEATRLDTRGIAELPVQGLNADAAGELLAGAENGQIAAAVAGRLIAATEGNPLALVEIPRASRPAPPRARPAGVEGGAAERERGVVVSAPKTTTDEAKLELRP